MALVCLCSHFMLKKVPPRSLTLCYLTSTVVIPTSAPISPHPPPKTASPAMHDIG